MQTVNESEDEIDFSKITRIPDSMRNQDSSFAGGRIRGCIYRISRIGD